MEVAAQSRVRSLPAADRARELEHRIAWIVVVAPLAGLAIAVLHFWNRGVSSADLALCLAFSVISILGITGGYHRLFTHQSFKACSSVRWVFGIAGAMAVQGPLFFWVACHRRHHQHSDAEHDPHSPLHKGESIAGRLKGFWHAHVGWMFCHDPEPWGRYVPDLLRDAELFRINNAYLVGVGLGLVIPMFVGGLIGGLRGALTGSLWGGPVRIFLVHHITWSINSLCHMAGSRPYETGDDSRNNVLCGVLALGEGWHNNHHAFPTSARHGLAWWQFDATYLLIRNLAALGLAWDIKVPSESLVARKRATASFSTGSIDAPVIEGTLA